jgi:hypothetical protein
LLVGGTAFAQPDPNQLPAPDGQPPVPQPVPQPQPQPTPPQPPQPPVITSTPAPSTEGTATPLRPEGFALGIGIGYRFPTSLTVPNAASVRFRLPSGLTFEPTVILASSSQSEDTGMAVGRGATEVAIGAVARFPLVGHRRTDLEFLGAFNVDRLNTDPSDQVSDDNTTVTTTTLSYGLAVGLWITQHLQVTLSATNPLVNYVYEREEQGIDVLTIRSTTTFGLVFDPTVTAMIHLYN